MTTETLSICIPIAIAGILLGMGGGVLLALLLGKPSTMGMSFGMGIGVAGGIFFDKKQPKCTKFVVVSFFSAVLFAALLPIFHNR